MKGKKAGKIQGCVRKILFQDWNPLGGPVPEDEYDGYITPIYRILFESRPEQKLVEFLLHTEQDILGTSELTKERVEELHRIAQHLLELDVRL